MSTLMSQDLEQTSLARSASPAKTRSAPSSAAHRALAASSKATQRGARRASHALAVQGAAWRPQVGPSRTAQ